MGRLMQVSWAARGTAPRHVGHRPLTYLTSPLGAAWQEIPFLVPEETLVPGKNVFCLRFTRALSEPGEPAVAALVEKIQLP